MAWIARDSVRLVGLVAQMAWMAQMTWMACAIGLDVPVGQDSPDGLDGPVRTVGALLAWMAWT